VEEAESKLEQALFEIRRVIAGRAEMLQPVPCVLPPRAPVDRGVRGLRNTDDQDDRRLLGGRSTG
jgi:hypothetical protein